jgi:drug/metabolite transporter (DMT)-like permease
VSAPLGLYAKLVLMTALWGGQFIAGRTLAPLLPDLTAGTMRFLAATVVLVVLVWLREGGLPRLDRRQLGAMIALGFSGVFLWNVFFFAGMERVAASRGALIMALNPIAISIGMWLVYGERMTGWRWLGIAVALAGAAIVISHGDLPSLFTGAIGPGEAFIFGSVVGWAVYTLIGRRVLGRVSALATTTYAALFGTAMLAVGAVVERPWAELAALPAKGWAAIAYLGVLGTVVAFLWFYEGVQRIGASRTGVFINLVPVFGVTFGAVLLGEPVLASMVIGGLFVIAGVALTNRPAHAAASPPVSAR